jgi:hypothetical protein
MSEVEAQHSRLWKLFENKVSIETKLPHITETKMKKRLHYFLESVVSSIDPETLELLEPLFTKFIETQEKVSDKFFNCSLVLMIDLIKSVQEEEEKEEFYFYHHYKMYILYITAEEYKSHGAALYDFFEQMYNPNYLIQNIIMKQKMMDC